MFLLKYVQYVIYIIYDIEKIISVNLLINLIKRKENFMRKFLFTLALIFSAFINVNAQTAYEKADRLMDNTSLGVVVGATTPLSFDHVMPLNATVGLKLGKQFSPVWGANIEGTAFLGDANFGASHTVFRAINTGVNGTVNLTNLLGTFDPARSFTVSTEAGIGWLTLLNNHNSTDNNEFTAKTGLVFAWNLGKAKATQLFVEPAVRWNLTNNLNSDAVTFDKNHAQLALEVGLVHRFRTSNGTHDFKVYDVGALNREINMLREQLAAKPNEVVRTVETVRNVETVRTVGTNQYVVFFDTNSILLTDDAKRTLDAIGENAVVTVSAYADAPGSEKYNQQLSEQRANVVVEYLTRRGLKVDSSTGYGETGDIVARVAVVKMK